MPAADDSTTASFPGPVLLHRASNERSRARSTRAASLLAFVVFAGAIVDGLGAGDVWPWLLLVGVTVTAGIREVTNDIRWRFRGLPPFRLVRRALSLSPDASGFRSAHRASTLLVDGAGVDLGPAPRLVLARSGVDRSLRFHLSLVAERELIVVEAIRTQEEATALADKLSEVLELAPLPPGAPLEDLEPAGAVQIKLAFFTFLLALIDVWVVWWGVDVDLPGQFVEPPVIVAVLLLAVYTIGRLIRLHWLQSEVGKAAQALQRGATSLIELPRRFFQRRLVIGTSVVALSTAAAFGARALAQAGEPALPRAAEHCFQPPAAQLCLLDVAGDSAPEVLGSTCNKWGSGPAALVVATGELARTTPMPREPSNLRDCRLPFIDTSSRTGADFTVSDWMPSATTVDGSSWKVAVPGRLKEVVRDDDCVLLSTSGPESRDAWRSLSLATGEACETIPEPVSAAVVAAVRQKSEERSARLEQARHTSDGITYTLEASGRALALSASRQGKALWRRELPGKSLDGLPLAIAGGTVVVAAGDARTGRHLRLIGVDGVTGEVRYVHRHPRHYGPRIHVVAAGSPVLVWSGQLAAITPGSGQVAWITEDRDD